MPRIRFIEDREPSPFGAGRLVRSMRFVSRDEACALNPLLAGASGRPQPA